jgi:hypothetical protein
MPLGKRGSMVGFAMARRPFLTVQNKKREQPSAQENPLQQAGSRLGGRVVLVMMLHTAHTAPPLPATREV